MSLNPIQTGDVEIYLDFISDGTGRIRISEPVGFDGLNFKTDAATDRYAKESSFVKQALIIDSKTNLEAFNKLLLYQKIYKTSAEVNLIITTYGVDYIIGSYNFQSFGTDQITYFECFVDQELKIRQQKARESTKVDVFSERDLDLNPITPVSTSNILLKAKPDTQISKWEKVNFWAYTGASFDTNQYFQNPIKNQIDLGIKNSYSWLPSASVSNGDVMNNANDFKLIEAKNNLTENTIKFENVQLKYLVPTGDAFGDTGSWYLGTVAIQFMINIGVGTAPNTFSSGYNLTYTAVYQSTYDVTGMYGSLTGVVDEYLVTIQDEEFTVPDIEKDANLWGIFYLRRILTITDWVSGSITIQSTSTGIDSIVKGVRLVDAQKKVVESICGNTVTAPMYDTGGEFDGNYVMNGNMARGFVDKPFTISLKNIANQLQEQNADYRTIGNETFIGGYADFYKNVDGGSYLTPPNEDFKITSNEFYNINKITFSYKEYETNEDEVNTKDAVHTKTEWNIPNKFSQGEIKNEIEFIRDHSKIEYIRARGTSTKPTTALSEDDKTIILDVTDLPANTVRSITALMNHNIDEDGNVQLLNDSTYNWTLLGFDVGDSFTIVTGENIDDYTVLSFEFSIITLEPVSTTPTFSGLAFTKVSYTVTNTILTNRTNELFDEITGLSNGDNFANLRYTPRRNMVNWEPVISTSMLSHGVDITNNTEFINGGNVTTQYDGGAVITENADILKSEIQTAILDAEVLNTVLNVSWEQYNSIRDNTLQGNFIRVADNLGGMVKIHPRQMSYSWYEKKLEITKAEIRLESEFVEITTNGSLITINRAHYDASIVGDIEWDFENTMVMIYDVRFVPLIKSTRYDYFKINDVTYDTPEALAAALKMLGE